MSTVARLPPEPFTFSSESSSSIISPLSLPRGATGYFDYVGVTSHPASTSSALPNASASNALNGIPSRNVVYSPLSPAVRGPPQFLSPHLTPITKEVQYHLQQQPRSVSLSPTRRMANTTMSRSRSAMISPPAGLPPTISTSSIGMHPPGVMSSLSPPSVSSTGSHPRSVSTDSASAPSQIQTIRRLVQQNRRIQEAWEAERKYMEANRERAEEVYKEERALMEDERAEWEAEKLLLLQEIDQLQRHVIQLGGGVSVGVGNVPAYEKPLHSSGQTLRGGGTWDISPETMRSPEALFGMTQPGHRNRSLMTAAGGDVTQGSIPTVAFQPVAENLTLPQPVLSLQTRFSPSKQPESSPFIPSTTSSISHVPNDNSTDMMLSSDIESGPIPIVDVQEIHPELEGIPIKANTIQKATFTDKPSPSGSRSSSRTSSPHHDPASLDVPKPSSKEQTLQVLAAAESDRLTMHAGHTPNHSLSVVPTVSASAVTTASSSGESTPTIQIGDLPLAQEATSMAKGGDQFNPVAPASSEEANSEDHPDTSLEPIDDYELKGPLMVRNMPAHDEIFFRRLSDKLEEVSKDREAALPAVLKDTVDAGADSKPTAGQAQAAAVDGGNEAEAEKDRGSPKSSDEEELEIPLKLKRSNNFGAPFGEFR